MYPPMKPKSGIAPQRPQLFVPIPARPANMIDEENAAYLLGFHAWERRGFSPHIATIRAIQQLLILDDKRPGIYERVLASNIIIDALEQLNKDMQQTPRGFDLALSERMHNAYIVAQHYIYAENLAAYQLFRTAILAVIGAEPVTPAFTAALQHLDSMLDRFTTDWAVGIDPFAEPLDPPPDGKIPE